MCEGELPLRLITNIPASQVLLLLVPPSAWDTQIVCYPFCRRWPTTAVMLLISPAFSSQLGHVMGCCFCWGTSSGRVMSINFSSELCRVIDPLLDCFVLLLLPVAYEGVTKKIIADERPTCSGWMQPELSFSSGELGKVVPFANTGLSPLKPHLLHKTGSHRWARVEALCLPNPHLTPHWRKP